MSKNNLILKAIKMRSKAFAPYSKYKVGAAVLTDSGEIFGGCNIENSSYSLTCCAERVALFKAYSEGFRTIKALSVSTENAGMPCGACRQVMAEYMSPHTAVYVYNDEEELKLSTTIEQLLPYKFDM